MKKERGNDVKLGPKTQLSFTHATLRRLSFHERVDTEEGKRRIPIKINDWEKEPLPQKVRAIVHYEVKPEAAMHLPLSRLLIQEA